MAVEGFRKFRRPELGTQQGGEQEFVRSSAMRRRAVTTPSLTHFEVAHLLSDVAEFEEFSLFGDEDDPEFLRIQLQNRESATSKLTRRVTSLS